MKPTTARPSRPGAKHDHGGRDALVDDLESRVDPGAKRVSVGVDMSLAPSEWPIVEMLVRHPGASSSEEAPLQA